MIEVRFRGCSLEADGHAGSGPAGEDLVCAAFSMLMYTLRANLEDVRPPGLEISMEPGRVRMRCSYNTKARAAMEFTRRGVEILARAYPGCVAIACL